jgi:hypothetical protein
VIVDVNTLPQQIGYYDAQNESFGLPDARNFTVEYKKRAFQPSF